MLITYKESGKEICTTVKPATTVASRILGEAVGQIFGSTIFWLLGGNFT